ncbi:MAG: hypothetical protein LBL58_17865 [Tannerellaceae bacterium]|jgi:hypothetical protein|nr:hypothetical protein [Tannerellaceae bacterium]
MKTTFLKTLVLTTCSIFFMCSYVADTGMFEGSGDVGNPKLKGSVSYDAAKGIYTLTGAGANIWDKADEFFFVWEKVTGDFSMSTKLNFEGVDPVHRKIGIMIRETLDGDAKYADISIHGDGLNSLQWRPEKGAATLEIASAIKAPDHITIERRGNKVIMKTAIGQWPDKVDAAQRATNFPSGTETTIELPATCYVGFFICSHVVDKIEKAYFSEVQFKQL